MEPLNDSDAALRKAVEALAGGSMVRTHDLGGHDGYELWIEKREGFQISEQLLRRLQREGWLEPYGNGAQSVLSDKGRGAYFRSTDELQDGRLIPPLPEAS